VIFDCIGLSKCKIIYHGGRLSLHYGKHQAMPMPVNNKVQMLGAGSSTMTMAVLSPSSRIQVGLSNRTEIRCSHLIKHIRGTCACTIHDPDWHKTLRHKWAIPKYFHFHFGFVLQHSRNAMAGWFHWTRHCPWKGLQWCDALWDGLADANINIPMGMTAKNVAK